MEKKKNEFGNEVNQDWKLNKRVTLPEDCNLDTIDVVCDKKKTIGSVTQRLRWITPAFLLMRHWQIHSLRFRLTIESPYPM